MTLQQRISDLNHLGNYIKSNNEDWQKVKELAHRNNQWFTPQFIDLASNNIADNFLQADKLEQWAKQYNIPQENKDQKTVGLVMAGNTPLVGFHDMLCIFISGRRQLIKPSSKDEILVNFLVRKMIEFDPEVAGKIVFANNLKGCDAYIATASNNSEKYFDYYFGKYPSIIRKDRTSVAIVEGNESMEDLNNLADDIQLYFGLGSRNVTKIYVPENYNFEPLLRALDKYEHYADFHKYKHNYDYQLALLMMGNKMYMTNGSVLFAENKSIFSAVSQVHYEYYKNKEALVEELKNNDVIQSVLGKGLVPFGQGLRPTLIDYPDGIDTMKFLVNL